MALVQICVGFAIGCIGISIYKGNWEVLPGWIAAFFWAVGWRMEISSRELAEKDAKYWRGVADEQMRDALDKINSEALKYVTQKELDERRNRVMEFDFAGMKDKDDGTT